MTAAPSLARAATATKRMEQLLPTIEALTLAADAARITAETATAACNDARNALAICEEAGVDRRAADLIAIAPSRDRPLDDRPAEEPDDARIMVHEGGRQPAIYRLLDGDGETMARIVDAAVHTPDERRQLQLDLSGLVDAIVAGAIEQAFLDFPPSHRFWAGLTRVESREVAVGLAGLGYRFDGLGGFDGGRVPSARDLSPGRGLCRPGPAPHPPVAHRGGEPRAVPGRHRGRRRVPREHGAGAVAERARGAPGAAVRDAGRPVEPVGPRAAVADGHGRADLRRRRGAGKPSAADVPMRAPSSLAHWRSRCSMSAGSRIWLVCARSAASLRSNASLVSTHTSA